MAAGGILFATNPSVGLSNPLLAIAGELKRRGTGDVAFACADERKAAVEALPGDGSVEFVSLGPYKPQLWPDNWDDETFRHITARRGLRGVAWFLDTYADFDVKTDLYRRMLEHLDRIRPSVAVIDSYTPWAIDAALTRGVPYLLNVSLPVSGTYLGRLPSSFPSPLSGLPAAMTGRQKLANAWFKLGLAGIVYRPKHLRATVAYVRRRKAEGLANPTELAANYADRAVAVLGNTVFGLEYPFPAPANLKMLGAMVPGDAADVPLDGALGEWLAAHESVVYIGLGTIMRLDREQVAAIVEVVRRLAPEHHVLWKVPRGQRHLLPPAEELPANLRVEHWLPSQHAVLAHPHVRVFFNHGGGNAVHEGVYFAKPLLVMPFWMDCYDFAVRFVDAGAALAVECSN